TRARKVALPRPAPCSRNAASSRIHLSTCSCAASSCSRRFRYSLSTGSFGSGTWMETPVVRVTKLLSATGWLVATRALSRPINRLSTRWSVTDNEGGEQGFWRGGGEAGASSLVGGRMKLYPLSFRQVRRFTGGMHVGDCAAQFRSLTS